MAVVRKRRSWTLRARLLAVVLALLAAVCAIIGVTTVVSLKNYMVDQLDHELFEMSKFAGRGPGGGPDKPVLDSPNALRFLNNPGAIGVIIVDGDVVAADRSVRGSTAKASLTTAEADSLANVSPGKEPESVNVPNLGNYRVSATSISGVVATSQGFEEVTGKLVIGLPLDKAELTTTRLATLLTGISLMGLGTAALVGAWLIGRTLRPLRRVAGTATRVSELPLDKGEVALAERVPEQDTDPNTEVGQVGSALNRMLDHIDSALTSRHQSEQRVRQFVADASHELRTPLAAIRGYAEVARRGDEPVPADVSYALSRVESQSDRMAALVDDLLLLARLDSGRPLGTEQVDLSLLLVEAVDDAHVAGPEHHWKLELPEEPVTLSGDGMRLHQVVANLLTNARTHTPPKTTITVRLKAASSVAAATSADGKPSGGNGFATLTVTDDGPGIPPDLLPDVFERFARGDSSRSRAAGSTGLGLSIVAAVAEAHHGTVTVESAPGNTTFTITLPLSTTPAPGE